MTGEVKGLAILGLGLFCPAALVLAGVGYLAGQIAGEEYRSAIRDADAKIKKEFEGCAGEAANKAANTTTSLGELLAPFTFGVSAVWMGVQAWRIRNRMEEIASSEIKNSKEKQKKATASWNPPKRIPAPVTTGATF